MDWSSIEPGPTEAIRPREGADYDPRPREDHARRLIAYALIGLLTFIVWGVLMLVASSEINVQEIKEFAVLLGPVVTLVSAATGFLLWYEVKELNSDSI